VQLTSWQREVLRLIAEDRRVQESAATLQLSRRTVETHKYQ
jgi:DNA-binding CsgD family transcriptional regulator